MLELARYRHFLLYCKGHYDYGDDWKGGLKAIVSDYCGLPLENITSYDCCVLMGDAFAEYTNKSVENVLWMIAHDLEDVNEFYYKDSNNQEDERYWRFCGLFKSKLSIVTVNKGNVCVLNLGKPDSNILPITDEDFWENKERL